LICFSTNKNDAEEKRGLIRLSKGKGEDFIRDKESNREMIISTPQINVKMLPAIWLDADGAEFLLKKRDTTKDRPMPKIICPRKTEAMRPMS